MRVAYFCALFLALMTSCDRNSVGAAEMMAKIDLVKKKPALAVYRIKEGEAEVKGTLVRRVDIGKTSAVVTYLNTGKEAIKPSFRFRLIDDYGIEVGRFEDHWLVSSVAAGETRKAEKSLEADRNVDELLEFSAVGLPEDWAKPVYLLIEGSQP